MSFKLNCCPFFIWIFLKSGFAFSFRIRLKFPSFYFPPHRRRRFFAEYKRRQKSNSARTLYAQLTYVQRVENDAILFWEYELNWKAKRWKIFRRKHFHINHKFHDFSRDLAVISLDFLHNSIVAIAKNYGFFFSRWKKKTAGNWDWKLYLK